MEPVIVKSSVLLLALLPALSFAADPATPPPPSSTALQYVSDNLYTFMHGGPGKQFRIIGSIKAGEPVQLLGHSADGQYSQIIDPKGRTAWIASESLQPGESFKVQAPKLQQKIDALQHTLDNLDSEQARQIKTQKAELEQLRQQTAQQSAQLAKQQTALDELQQQNKTLQSSLDTREQDAQYRWWREGATIAAAGLGIGLLLPWLPRPRRRKDRWMN